MRVSRPTLYRDAAFADRTGPSLRKPDADRIEGAPRSRTLFADLRSHDRPELRRFLGRQDGESRADLVRKLVSAQVNQVLIGGKNAPGFVSRSRNAEGRDRFEGGAKVVMEFLGRRSVDGLHSNRAPDDCTIALAMGTILPLKLQDDGPRDPAPLARVPASKEPACQEASPGWD